MWKTTLVKLSSVPFYENGPFLLAELYLCYLTGNFLVVWSLTRSRCGPREDDIRMWNLTRLEHGWYMSSTMLSATSSATLSDMSSTALGRWHVVCTSHIGCTALHKAYCLPCLTLCKWKRTIKQTEWVSIQLTSLTIILKNGAKDGLKSGLSVSRPLVQSDALLYKIIDFFLFLFRFLVEFVELDEW